MTKVNINGVSLYLDETLKQNLDVVRKFIETNWDYIILVTGAEGAGKSTLAAQVAYYLDSGFNLDQIVFNPKQFYEALEKAPVGSAILWDEADVWSSHWSSRILQTLKQTFKRIRSKRLYVILATPTFFDLGKYLAIHRSKVLIEVFASGYQRGFFNFYATTKKRYLYFKGIKYWDMSAQKPDFFGRFTKNPPGFPIDMSFNGAYETKKQAATSELTEAKRPHDSKEVLLSFKLECVRRGDEANLPDKVLGELLGVVPRTIRSYRRLYREQLGLKPSFSGFERDGLVEEGG